MFVVWLKKLIIWLHDAVVVSLISLFVAFLFPPHEFSHFISAVAIFALAAVGVQLLSNFAFRVYRGYWSFVSVKDLLRIIEASFVSAAVLLFVSQYILPKPMPWQNMLVYAIFSVFMLAGSRLAYRLFFNLGRKHAQDAKRVLVIGAGEAAEYLIRDMTMRKGMYLPVAMIDDDPQAQQRELHGVRVLGFVKDLEAYIKKYAIDMVVIASSSAPSALFKHVLEVCHRLDVPLKTVPKLEQMIHMGGEGSLLRTISVDDLLGRDQVKLDKTAVGELISNKTVLVTGGGGSIGSELCRKIAELKPSKLVIVEHAEYNLYAIERELKQFHKELDVVAYLASVTDKTALRDIFNRVKPQIVFHAAAYKHVPLLEYQASCAVKNNAIGTYYVASLADEFAVDRFVLISTDKAVAPCNVMGATKRLCEIICQQMNYHSKTEFMMVRFGNVLGSVGSVVPLFDKQIRQGGPITLTHKDTTRYFMTIPEAAQLILQASCLGLGGDVFVLDMGKPVKIIDLAQQMIKMMGAHIDDIGIEIVGMRPGESLHEDLFYEEEQLEKTANAKIYRANQHMAADAEFIQQMNLIEQYALVRDEQKVLAKLTELTALNAPKLESASA